MTFISRPNHLSSLLSKMSFESLIEGHDNITITVYDGIGGDCLSAGEHMAKYNIDNVTGPFSVYNKDMNNGTCRKVERLIPVHVTRKQLQSNNGNENKFIFGDIPLQLWVAIIALVSSFAMISFCTYSSKARERRNKELDRIRDQRKKMNNETKTNKKKKNKSNKEDKKEEQDISEKLSDGTLVSKYISQKDDDPTIAEEGNVGTINEYSGHDIEDLEDIQEREIEQDEHMYDGEIESDDDSKEESERKNPDSEWMQHFDSTSGDNYYENMKTRRVTWTKPNVICINGDDDHELEDF
jgi:hypothetical protein